MNVSRISASLYRCSLVPRLFLVEERAWQHWGVGAVYFCYVMVHVIYSDHTLFLKIIMWFLRGHVVRIFQTIFEKDREKQHRVTRHQVNRINKTDHTIAAWSPKAGKLTIYSRKFLALPVVMVVHLPYNTLVKARITSCLERQYAVQ